jgi:hypothetical protein
MGEAMAEEGFLHTAEILKTALPYVDARSKPTLNLLVKLYELIIGMRNYNSKDMTACGFENEKADIETLLNNIRPNCNQQELSFVDKILNIFQVKKTFEMYNTYMEAMNVMQGFETEGSEGDDTSGFMNSFKGFDLSSLFAENQAETLDKEDSKKEDLKKEDLNKEDSNKEDSNKKDLNKEDLKKEDSNKKDSDEKDLDEADRDEKDLDEADRDNYLDPKENGSTSMMESLKAMIPPEQMGTFENLRMLLGSMSYDDNNKSDENKE